MYRKIIIDCKHCGETEINNAEYLHQLMNANRRWEHMICGDFANFIGIFYPCFNCGQMLNSDDGYECERCGVDQPDFAMGLLERPYADELNSNHVWFAQIAAPCPTTSDGESGSGHHE